MQNVTGRSGATLQ